jgi:hypothetical protein
MAVNQRIRDEYENLLKSVGEVRFFDHMFTTGISARKHFNHSENVMLEQSESFFSVFRSTGNENYFIIGRILRKVAHKLYRDNKKINKNYPTNRQFLQIVK